MLLPLKEPLMTHKPPDTYVFSILEAYPQTYDWLMSNYINFYITQTGKADFWGKDYFYEHCPWLLESHIPRDIFKKCDINFISFCKTCIDSGYYISCMINEKYIPAYDQKTNLDHNILIYGYDNDLFYIADFFKNRKYNFETCTYFELEKSFYDPFLENTNYFETIRLIKFRPTYFKINYDLICKELIDHIQSVNLFLKYNTVSYEENLYYDTNKTFFYPQESSISNTYFFGLNYYKKLAELYTTNNFNDLRPFHLIYSRMLLTKKRLEYFFEKGCIVYNNHIMNMINKNINDSIICRNLVLKYNISGKSQKRTSTIVNYLEHFAKCDKEICMYLLESLKKYRNSSQKG